MPFTDATKAVDDRLIVSVWGETKRGKTAFSLSFPEPIFYLDFDLQISELLRVRTELLKKAIQRAQYFVPENPTVEEAAIILAGFLDDYQDACEIAAKDNGTVVVDTATILNTLVQKVKVGERVEKRLKVLAQKEKDKKAIDPDLVKVFPYDYSDANALMRALLRRPKLYPTLNAVFIHRAREKWAENGAPTGIYEFHGFNETADIVEATIQMKKNRAGQIVGVIGPNRFNQDMEGMEVPNLDYETVKDMFLGSD